MSGKLPEGKGMFLWLLDRLEKYYSSMDALAKQLAEEGYRWVCIEVHQGTWTEGSYPDEDGNYDQQILLAELVPALEKYGIEFHAWGYTFGASKIHAAAEAEVALEQIELWKPLSYTVNAEHHHKVAEGATWAKIFMNMVRAGTEIPILLSSYKFPRSHPAFPWAAFIDRCDGLAPQVYWQKDYRVEAGVQQLLKAIAQWQAYAQLPVIPAGTVYPEGEWWATPDQLVLFMEACKEHPDVPGFNFWEYDYLKYKPANRAALANFVWEIIDDPGETGEGEEEMPDQVKLGEVLEIVRGLQADMVEVKTLLSEVPDIRKNLASHHLDIVALLGSGGVPGGNEGGSAGETSKQWQFSRSTGSRETKIFKLVDKGNGKVGPAEEFGKNQIFDIVWRVSDGDVVEELSISDYWPGYELASNTSPASSWNDLKFVRLTKIGNDGVERSKLGVIVRGFNDGVFINVGSGETW